MWPERIINRLFEPPDEDDDRANPCPACNCCELDNPDEDVCSNCRADAEIQIEEAKRRDQSSFRTWSNNAKRNPQ
jgi:hypothetical protein